MSTMQQALSEVGVKPRLRTLRRAAERERLRLETVVDEVFEPLIKRPLKVQITRVGGYFKARYEGRAICCFGHTPIEATKNLKFFDGATQ